MSEMFEALSEALDEAIADAKSQDHFLPRDRVSIEMEQLQPVCILPEDKTGLLIRGKG